MKKTIVTCLYILIVLSFVSCGGNSPQQPSSYNDTSHTLEEAKSRGLPDLDKQWEARDFDSFAVYLSGLDKATMLPHYKSKKSSVIIKKFAEKFNQPKWLDRSLNINTRFDIVLKVTDSREKIFNIYQKRQFDEEAYSEEMAVLMGSAIKITHHMFILKDEFMAALDPKDPTYNTRLQGIEQMKLGAFQVLKGCIVVLSDIYSYTESDLLRLAAYIESDGVPLLKHLKSDHREIIIKDFEQIATGHEYPKIRKRAAAILEKIK